MSLTPLDIKKKEFKKVMRGCDPVEVETFLEMVSENYADLKADNDDMQERLLHFSSEVERLESEVKKAKETAEEYKVPQKEAEIIIKEAEIKALEILEKSKSEANRIKEEIFVLKSQKNSFIKRLKHLFSAQLELIDVLEIEDEEIENIKELNKQLEKKKTKQTAKTNKNEDKSERLNELLSSLEKQETKQTQQIDNDLPFIKQKAKEILNKEKTENDEEVGKILDDLGD